MQEMQDGAAAQRTTLLHLDEARSEMRRMQRRAEAEAARAGKQEERLQTENDELQRVRGCGVTSMKLNMTCLTRVLSRCQPANVVALSSRCRQSKSCGVSMTSCASSSLTRFCEWLSTSGWHVK
jgi:hypothetical protein